METATGGLFPINTLNSLLWRKRLNALKTLFIGNSHILIIYWNNRIQNDISYFDLRNEIPTDREL
jgi:hypothetical protein